MKLKTSISHFTCFSIKYCSVSRSYSIINDSQMTQNFSIEYCLNFDSINLIIFYSKKFNISFINSFVLAVI